MEVFEQLHLWFHDKTMYEPGGHELLYIVFKLLLGFIILLTVSRLLGKKQLYQYTPFDFIFVVLLSGLLEETVYHHETPYFEFIVAIVVWSILSIVVEKLVQKFEKLRPIAKGQPILLIEKGNINEEALKESNLEMEQLRHALRSKGVFSLIEVDYAILETNGEISVKPKSRYETVKRKHFQLGEFISPEPFPFMVIEDGKIVPEELSGINEKDVISHFKLYGIDIQDVFYAEKKGDEYYYKLKGGGDNGQSNAKTN